MKYLFFLAILFSICEARLTSCRLPHRIYVGSDLYYRKFKQKYIYQSTSSYDNFFKGIQVGYDFVYPNSLYFGCEYYQNKSKALEKSSFFRTDFKNKILNYEGRLGLTFYIIRNCYFTLLASGGYYSLDRSADDDINLTYKNIKYSWYYLGGGARLYLFMCAKWQIGLFFKTNHMIKGSCKIERKDSLISIDYLTDKASLKEEWDYCIELPNYFYLKALNPLDFAVIPYMKNNNIKKGKLMAIASENQKIYTPTTKKYEIGIRLELGLHF
jgi:hypothetical protein